MKDSEFIELLNLYLDREIAAADAVRLEAEVAANPDRRRTYDEYCRMHKACGLVAMDFRATDGTVVAASEKVVPFDFQTAQTAARRRRLGGYLSSGLAAAACVALAFIGARVYSGSGESSGTTVAGETLAARSGATAQPMVQAATAGSTTARELGSGAFARTVSAEGPATPKWVGAPLVLSAQKADLAMTVAQQQADDQLAWIQSVQFAPIQSRLHLEQLRFDAQPASLQPDGRALGGRSTPKVDPAVETAAFRFVK